MMEKWLVLGLLVAWLGIVVALGEIRYWKDRCRGYALLIRILEGRYPDEMVERTGSSPVPTMTGTAVEDEGPEPPPTEYVVE